MEGDLKYYLVPTLCHEISTAALAVVLCLLAAALLSWPRAAARPHLGQALRKDNFPDSPRSRATRQAQERLTPMGALLSRARAGTGGLSMVETFPLQHLSSKERLRTFSCTPKPHTEPTAVSTGSCGVGVATVSAHGGTQGSPQHRAVSRSEGRNTDICKPCHREQCMPSQAAGAGCQPPESGSSRTLLQGPGFQHLKP